MARVEATVSATFRGGDIERVGKAISQALRSITGQDVQVVVNSRNKIPDRVGIWEMQRKPGNIEMRSRI